MKRLISVLVMGSTGLWLGLESPSVSAHGTVPFTTPNVVHACRVVLTGVLREIKSGSCLLIEAAVHWNVTGPQGQQGAKGDTGSTGATGATGPRGPSDAWSTQGDNTNLGVDTDFHTVADLTLPPGSYVVIARASLNDNGQDASAFCALRSAAGILTEMRVDLQAGPFQSTPFTLTAPVTLTETSNPIDLACRNIGEPDGTVIDRNMGVSSSELTAIQVANLH